MNSQIEVTIIWYLPVVVLSFPATLCPCPPVLLFSLLTQLQVFAIEIDVP